MQVLKRVLRCATHLITTTLNVCHFEQVHHSSSSLNDTRLVRTAFFCDWVSPCNANILEIIRHNLLILHLLQVERLSHVIPLPQVIHQRASLGGLQISTINNEILITSFAFPSNTPRASLQFPQVPLFSFAPESYARPYDLLLPQARWAYELPAPLLLVTLDRGIAKAGIE